MIAVQEAKRLIALHSKPLLPVMIALQQSAGLTLAQDVYAPFSLPSFSQSAMDGYAFCFNDYTTFNPLQINGQIEAGSKEQLPLLPNTAVRIFAGAPIPQGADTVVMQEKSFVQNNQLVIHDKHLKKGSNVKQIGSEIQQGELALSHGALLTPAAIGFLASMGITAVPVYPKPTVTIIITGKEIIQPGATLQYGQVYDANSFTIKAVLEQLHITTIKMVYTTDSINDIQTALHHALQQADMVVLSGGISAGNYDYVLQATRQCEVTEVFYKVNQKPGKPLYFGTKENKLVFGLPGNPAAALTCMYEYVMPAIEQLAIIKKNIRVVHLPLTTSFTKQQGKVMFLKGVCTANKVDILPAQESYRLSSFALANCLIYFDEKITTVQSGELTEVHILPQ